jgi:hypothetical protein
MRAVWLPADQCAAVTRQLGNEKGRRVKLRGPFFLFSGGQQESARRLDKVEPYVRPWSLALGKLVESCDMVAHLWQPTSWHSERTRGC